MNKVHDPCVYFRFQVKFLKKNIIFPESLNKYSCAIAVIAYYDNSISSLTRLNKRQRKPKVPLIMDELETQVTAAVKHRDKTNKINKHNTEKMSKMDPTKKQGVNPGACEE